MFEYAYARALSEKFCDKKIEINPYFTLYDNIANKKFCSYKNSLMNLCLNENVKEIGKLQGVFEGMARFVDVVINDTKFSRKPSMSQPRFEERSKNGIYQAPGWAFGTFYQCSETTQKNKHVTGWFQSEKYFKDIRHVLLEEFQVRKEASQKNKLKIEELQSCNSVCVHIRRGDYLNAHWSHLNICGEKYYQRGMDYIEEHIQNPVFYIFSNTNEEIKWIRENYHFRQKVNYIDLNNPDYEDLRLMYSCKHFVMTNSTFSWWGSYLAKNENKIIVAPSIWQRENSRPKDVLVDIYREDMVKIDVD